MNSNLKKHILLRNENGVSAVLVGIMITMFFGFLALAIDIGYGYLTRNQLQDAADAAALAATRWLGCKYAGNSDDTCPSGWAAMTYAALRTYNAISDAPTIISVAQDVASQNTVAEQKSGGTSAFVINSSDVTIGTWDPSRGTTPDSHFFATYTGTCANSVYTECLVDNDCPGGSGRVCNKPNAVRTIAQRNSSSNGPIATYFASIFGITGMNVSTRATAALTGQSTAETGGLPLPLGLSCWWAQNAACGDSITFYPTPTSCAGWNTYTDNFFDHRPPNASKLRAILDALTAQSIESPETIGGVTAYEFTGGTQAGNLAHMESLFNAMKVLNDGVLDADTDSATWTTAVPIFGEVPDGACTPCGTGGSNPSGDKLIVGFATIVMSEVIGPSGAEIRGRLICNIVEPGRGNGLGYGTIGSIPGLVQ